MSAILEREQGTGETTVRPRMPITREMVRVLVDAGLLNGRPFELIEGDIVYKMGKNRPHVYATNQALQWLAGIFGLDHIQVQDPIALSETSEPEPDLCVLRQPQAHYLAAGTPGPTEVLLVIEISDATLSYDRGIKARLYAEAGITEYWVVDLTGRQVYVHRDPQIDHYLTVTAHPETDSISPLAAPTTPLQISALLP